MRTSNLSKLYLFCFIFISCAACSQNEAQQQFEAKALSVPSGIQELDANGSPVQGGETDPDDWHIAPDFSGLAEIQTGAYTNPVYYNSSFKIEIFVKFTDAINGLNVCAFQQPANLNCNLYNIQGSVPKGTTTIKLLTAQFASSAGTGTIGNTYRIIFYNNRQKIITYGDVLVQ